MILRRSYIAWGLCALLSFPSPFSHAQQAGEPEAPEPASDVPIERIADDPASGARELPGDKIVLKNGHVMTGVQILRQTGSMVEVQIVEGVEPLFISRKNIQEIVWDSRNPLAEELRRKRKPPEPEATALGGQVSPELMGKLNKPISEEQLVFPQRGVVRILTDLTKRVDVPLEIDPSVKQLPPVRLLWDVTIPPGTTLMQVIQNQFKERFPDFVARIEFEKLKIMTAEVAEEMDAETAAPADPPLEELTPPESEPSGQD